MKFIFYISILQLLLSASSCQIIDKPYAPHHDFNILLEYQTTEGTNVIDHLNEQEKGTIEVYTLIGNQKTHLHHKVKIGHQFDDGQIFSGIYTNQLNAENIDYFVSINGQTDTLSIIVHQNEDQLRWIEAIYFNHKKLHRSKKHKDRSLFILVRDEIN
ncbi:hypothetical protein [Flammeovirga sp. SJP92]|uniref:hypothetical protein n=1 Tax=Flammeovirga sp. SJP92 TaxID=1775430 RepID=UPI0007883A5D|nr:hypothetical protein [Flammeovirga sp. SJP92]KXX69495.1 hypothetical protein AVL50_15590 [Flammeovirga sp. SJP92]